MGRPPPAAVGGDAAGVTVTGARPAARAAARRILQRIPVLWPLVERMLELARAEDRCRRMEDRYRRVRDLHTLQKRRSRQLAEEFRKVAAHRYGSHTPGCAGWEERWDRSPGRRVLLCAVNDFAGSFFKWAEAVNRHTDYAARLAVFKLNRFRHRVDLVLPHPDLIDPDLLGRAAGVRALVSEADVVHVKDERGPFAPSSSRLPEVVSACGKPRIYTAYGGYFRKLAADDGFRRHVAAFDARVALTPDLVHDWFDARFIPQAIDADANRLLWSDGRLIMHSPTRKERKGTDDLLEAVRGLDVEFEMIFGVDHEECLRRKRRANLFFDQAGREGRPGWTPAVIGWYGNAALEAAVHGIPTIAHLSAAAFDGARRAGRDVEADCAIINTPLGAEGIRKTVEEYFALSRAERTALSLRTRKWVEDFHGYRSCARDLASLYDDVLRRGAARRRGA